MEFTLNSQNKKVEVFYKTAEEQMAILRFMQEYITLYEDSTHNLGVDRVITTKPATGITWTDITPCDLTSSSAVISTIHPNDTLTIKYSDINNNSLSSESSTGFVTGMSTTTAIDKTTNTIAQENVCSSNCYPKKRFNISTYNGLEEPGIQD